jgi:NDP-sugar pyrophosphorylase family protein
MTQLQDHSIVSRRFDAGRHIAPRAVVLLSGTVRSTPFHAAINRSPLELPLSHDRQLLDDWKDHQAALSYECGQPVELRVLLDRNAPRPVHRRPQHAHVRIEHDTLELRGTGGILRDLAEEFDDEDLIVVTSGAQLLGRPLRDFVSELAECEADVAIAAHNGALSSVLFLVRCGCLRTIAQRGFIDFKEQALPAIAARGRVVVREWPNRIGIPIRSESQYISALKWYHRGSRGAAAFEEDWECRFRIVEPGANVHPETLLHDAVILRTAQVGRGATIVRSLVCEGATVRRGITVADVLVTR